MTKADDSGFEAVVLYDGHCEFCTAQAKRLAGGSSRVAIRSFHDDGVLDNYPGLTLQMCMESMKLVRRDGRMFEGAEAVVRAAAIRHRFVGAILLAFYYIPGIRGISDRAYAWIAKNRYRIMRDSGECETGECRLHGGPEINE